MITVIKNKPGKTSRMIEKTLSEDTDFNNFIKENVREVENWIIYANDNFFSKENRIESYQGIRIIYNDFFLTDNVVILQTYRR